MANASCLKLYNREKVTYNEIEKNIQQPKVRFVFQLQFTSVRSSCKEAKIKINFKLKQIKKCKVKLKTELGKTHFYVCAY